MTRDDTGCATISMLAVIAVVAIAAGVVMSVGTVMLDRHRAASAADETALAVASIATQGATVACIAGGRIARLDGARLSQCRVADAIATVEVLVPLPGWLARFGSAAGRARAGPASAN